MWWPTKLDTPANVVVCALCLLALHPEKQQQLFHELEDTFKDPEMMSVSNIKPLKYLTAVLNETMRCKIFKNLTTITSLMVSEISNCSLLEQRAILIVCT